LGQVEAEQAHQAIVERIETLHENLEDDAFEAACELGRRLMYTRTGSIAEFSNRPEIRTRKQRTTKASTSDKSADPDDRAKLVAALSKTLEGCIWMRARWQELQEQLSPGNVFQSPDRLKAVRLLGFQVAQACTERTVAEIFVASDVLHRQGLNPFDDLL